MSKTRLPNSKDLSYEMAKMMIPTDFLDFFEVFDIKELNQEWQIILHEKSDLIPKELNDCKNVVLDGFCNPINLLSHCFSLKPIYLVMYRRRWKESNQDTHYSNEYTLTKDSAKLTANMAGFLKI